MKSNIKLLEKVKKYIENNLEKEQLLCCAPKCEPIKFDYLNENKIKERIEFLMESTWQEDLFYIIDTKKLNDVDVYKGGGLTKQTFSKIRCDKDYHPDKDTAIRLCIGLKLNIDETLDMLDKAGYTLSYSIERDLVIRYFFEHEMYDIYELDCVLEDLGLKQFLKY